MMFISPKSIKNGIMADSAPDWNVIKVEMEEDRQPSEDYDLEGDEDLNGEEGDGNFYGNRDEQQAVGWTDDGKAEEPQRHTPLYPISQGKYGTKKISGRKRKDGSGRSNYRKNIHDGNEEEMVDFFKDNRSLWDPRDKDYGNREIRLSLLHLLSQSVGVSVTDIEGWWKSMRDTFTRLMKTKSGEALDNLPYKQNWILTKFSFLRKKPNAYQDSLKSVKATMEDNMVDLVPAERDAARQGKDLDELDLEALQRVAADNAATLAAIQETVCKASDPKSMDRVSNFGAYLIDEMRGMSRGRFKNFKKEVMALLLKYQSSTSDEDEERSGPKPKKSRTGYT